MRISGIKKDKRTDLVKDEGDSNQFKFHSIEENYLRRVKARRELSSNRKTTIKWDYVPLMHPEAVGVAIKVGYIDQGAERAAYELSEVTMDHRVVGQKLVAKVSNY